MNFAILLLTIFFPLGTDIGYGKESQPSISPQLKGLGHAILGNFSTDQMVVE